MHTHTVRAALQRLGPEKVKRGMVAFKRPTPGRFHSCFVARCYGRPGALVKAGQSDNAGFSVHLGLTPTQMWELVDAYDQPETRRELQGEAERFLAEAARVSA
jgi:hypothetical protein